MKKTLGLILAGLLVSSVALAVPANKTLEFNQSTQGLVKFDGTLHKEAGNACKDCHNKDVFPKMKQGSVEITMDAIYAGQLCGVCHNGQRAFDAKGNCERCHIKQ